MCEENSNDAEHVTNSAQEDTVRGQSMVDARYRLLVTRPTMAANPEQGAASRESDAGPAYGSESDSSDLSDSDTTGRSRSDYSPTEASQDDDRLPEAWHSADEDADTIEEEDTESVENSLYWYDTMRTLEAVAEDRSKSERRPDENAPR